MANITFQQGDQNMSVIPPSPIPTSLPIRLYSEGASSSSGKNWYREKIAGLVAIIAATLLIIYNPIYNIQTYVLWVVYFGEAVKF